MTERKKKREGEREKLEKKEKKDLAFPYALSSIYIEIGLQHPLT